MAWHIYYDAHPKHINFQINQVTETESIQPFEGTKIASVIAPKEDARCRPATECSVFCFVIYFSVWE